MQSADLITYKVLTLRQPYAYLLVHGLKHFETRGWRTDYRGLLLIHAGVSLKDLPMCSQPYFREALAGKKLALGALVGSVEITDIDRTECLALTDQEYAFGNYAAGRFAWYTRNAQAFATPYPMKGKLSLWTCQRDDLRGGAVQYVEVNTYANP